VIAHDVISFFGCLNQPWNLHPSKPSSHSRSPIIGAVVTPNMLGARQRNQAQSSTPQILWVILIILQTLSNAYVHIKFRGEKKEEKEAKVLINDIFL
jgi:hypothetical protein